MKKLLLLGDEAIAQGAIDAGLSGVYAYPGTPSTEITEYIQHSKEAQELNIHRDWSANEKTAMEAAIGMSYAGKRTLVCMKHVGLNVAGDPFMNSAFVGANGGLVYAVADDPSMHSSQNEQDTRFMANFARLPYFEPSSQQEAYDMMAPAFDLSEKYGMPVLMRITTRLAHSRAGVVRTERKEQNPMSYPKDIKGFVLLPAISRRRQKELEAKQPKLIQESEVAKFNSYRDGEDKRLGVIACGLAYNYLMENVNDDFKNPILKICQYPAPRKLVEKMYNECDEVLVLEEGFPIIEEQLRGYMNLGKTVHGRLDGTLPRDGELNPTLVAKALGFEVIEGENVPEIVAGRPPALCKGCPHIDSYMALKEVLMEDGHGDGHVFSDIGCYTLGALPPFEAINSCVDMGASITMAKGASDAGLFPAVGVIGDSTFTHSGMTGLLDCVMENTNCVVMILDNSTTAMTGGQDSHAFGRIENICVGLGVDPKHIRVINPLKKFHEENKKVMREEIAYKGVSVVIPRRECIQTLARRTRKLQKQKGAK